MFNVMLEVEKTQMQEKILFMFLLKKLRHMEKMFLVLDTYLNIVFYNDLLHKKIL